MQTGAEAMVAGIGSMFWNLFYGIFVVIMIIRVSNAYGYTVTK